MGLIKAALTAGSSVLADQWLEYIYCERMEDNVLMRKGVSKKEGSNTKGTDNIIGFQTEITDSIPESHITLCDRFKTIPTNISSATDECIMVGAGIGNLYVLINKSRLAGRLLMNIQVFINKIKQQKNCLLG